MNKICFFHPASDLYGSDKILLQLLREYNNYEITVVLRSNGILIDKIEEIGGIKIIIEPSLPILAKKYINIAGIFQFLRQLFIFKRQIKRHNLYSNNIIYLNTIATSPILLFFNKKYKRIIHLHEIVNAQNIVYNSILKFIAKRADAIICVSDAVKNTFKNIKKRCDNKIFRIYNGIPIMENSETNNKLPYKHTSDLINMALIGRIKPQTKGQNIYIEAISSLKQEEIEKCHFYIVGSTVSGQEYMLDELKQYIHENKIDTKVTIVPFVLDVAQVYSSMDVIVVPSTYEDPLPTTVLEAISMKKAVIGSISGGIPEMIKNNENGLLVDKNNSEQLCNAMQILINNPDKITEMGEKGYEIFKNNFTTECFHKNYHTIITQILK